MNLLNHFIRVKSLDIQALPNIIYAPITGFYYDIGLLPDEVFSQRVLGDGCGITPTDGNVFSPVTGTISAIAETKHAIGIQGVNGEEYLIHVGMDTVDMNGNGFDVKVKVGDEVNPGNLLLYFNIGEIKKSGHSIETALVLTNSQDYPNFKFYVDSSYKAGVIVGSL